MKLLSVAILLITLVSRPVRAASYDLAFELGPCTARGCNEIVGYTEGQMFAKGDGPPSFVLSDNDEGYIGVEADVSPSVAGVGGQWPTDSKFRLSAFACTRYARCLPPGELICPAACSDFYDNQVGMGGEFCDDSDYPIPLYGEGASNNITWTLAGDTGKLDQVQHVSGKFYISKSTQQLIVFRLCLQGGSTQFTVVVDSKLSFYNSYGFIPGKLVGYVPVYFMLLLGLVLVILVYGGLAIAHFSELLLLQGLIMGVQLLSLFEAATWFGFFLSTNDTGEPMCCPLSNTAMFAIGCTVSKQLVSRVLMTLVAIGFGVVRQRIEKKELVGLLTLSTFYFLMAFMDEIATTNAMGDSMGIVWSMGVLVCDLVFVYWVMTGLRKTMDGLAQNRASLKFKMYANMSSALFGFMIAWVVYGLLLLALNAFLDFGPFETTLLGSLWPVIYFAFLVTISVIWRPSTQSHMLAMSFELSTDEISPDVELDHMPGPEQFDNVELHNEEPPARAPAQTSVGIETENLDHSNLNLEQMCTKFDDEAPPTQKSSSTQDHATM